MPYTETQLRATFTRLGTDHVKQRLQTLVVLRDVLAADSDARSKVVVIGGAEELVAQMGSSELECRHRAASVLAALGASDASRAAILAAGALPPLVSMLSQPHREAQEEAASALCSLAATERCRGPIIAAGAVEPLKQLLSGGSSKGQAYAGHALGLLATHLPSAMVGGLLPALVQLLSEAAATSAGSQAADDADSAAGGATGGPALAAILPPSPAGSSVMSLITDISQANKDDTAAVHVACALATLACNNANRKAIIAAKALPPLARLLGSSNTLRVREQVASVLGNLAIEDDDFAHPPPEPPAPVRNGAIIAETPGVVPGLVDLLRLGGAEFKERESASAEAARALAQLAECEDQREQLVAAGALAPLVLLLRDGNPRAKGWAAGTLRQLTTLPSTKEAVEAVVPQVAKDAGAQASLMAILSMYCF